MPSHWDAALFKSISFSNWGVFKRDFVLKKREVLKEAVPLFLFSPPPFPKERSQGDIFTLDNKGFQRVK